jgi:tRNA threonylcarbamoyladenosine biosynthesis protein TsaB
MPSRATLRQRDESDVSPVLAFDCAVSGLAVAVLNAGGSPAVHREPGREQAARLLPAIAGVLAAAGVDRRALSMIAVTVGPGSFTGVRVGLAAARGLAVALGVPLAGIATTAVLLAQAQKRARGRVVVAAVDSHLGDWFCAIGAEGEDRPGMPFAADAAELLGRLGGRRCLVVGLQATQLAARLVDLGLDAEGQEVLPDPVVLGRLAVAEGIEAWRAHNRTEGLARPLYLRGVNITLPSGERRTVE